MPTNKKIKSKLKKEQRKQRREHAEERSVEDLVKAFAKLPVPEILSSPAPPSYTVPISGIPLANSDKNDSRTEGFRGLGKLVGTQREIWVAGLKALVSEGILGSRESSGIATPFTDQLPLFTRLSPHQRIRLLREVAVGLLCKETPLPPETVFHYSAFIAPFAHIVFVKIKGELKFQQAYVLRRREKDNLEAVLWEAQTKREDAQAAAAASECNKSNEAERKAIEMHERTKTKGTSTGSLVRDIEKSEDVTDLQLRFQNWMKIQDEQEMFCHFMLSLKKFAKNEQLSWDYRWRSLLIDFFMETKQNNSSLGLEATVSAMDVFRTDFVFWENAFRVKAYTSLSWPQEKNELFIGLLFGPVDYERNASRSRLIDRATKRSSKLFGKNWSCESSANDFRYLAVLVDDADCDDPFICEGVIEMVGNMLEDSDSARKKCSKSFLATTWTLDTSLESYPLEKFQDVQRWSWAHLWHNEMKLDSNQYNSMDSRVRAIEAVIIKIQGYERDGSRIKNAWKYSPCAGCEGDIASYSPKDLTEEQERCDQCSKIEGKDCKVLQFCQRCGIAQYCSQECQKVAWPDHKEVCENLKLIVEQGKGAAPIPLTASGDIKG